MFDSYKKQLDNHLHGNSAIDESTEATIQNIVE